MYSDLQCFICGHFLGYTKEKTTALCSDCMRTIREKGYPLAGVEMAVLVVEESVEKGRMAEEAKETMTVWCFHCQKKSPFFPRVIFRGEKIWECKGCGSTFKNQPAEGNHD